MTNLQTLLPSLPLPSFLSFIIFWRLTFNRALFIVKWKSLSRVQFSVTPWLYSPWNSLGQNTGVGSLSLLQGIIPTQGSNPGLSHCRQILYQLSHRGSPRILEWVAYPFSSGSSQPRNRTRVSCIAGRFSTNWDIREAQFIVRINSEALNLVEEMSEFEPWFS